MDFNNIFFVYREKIDSLGLNASEHLLLASVASQEILHLHNGKRLKNYVM